MYSTRYYCQSLMKLQFSRQIFETTISMKNRQVGAELFHVDGQTDVSKLIIYFLNFAKEPKQLFFRMVRGSTPFVWNTYESDV